MSEYTKQLPHRLIPSPQDPRWVAELKDVLNRILDFLSNAPFPRGDNTTVAVSDDGTVRAIPDDMRQFQIVKQYDATAAAYQAKARGGFVSYDGTAYDADWYVSGQYVEELSAALTLATNTANKVWIAYKESTSEAVVLVSATKPATGTYPASKHVATVTTDASDNITRIEQHWRGGNINFGDGSSGLGENDHSWHFTAATATTGTISDALFYYQGDKQTIAESSAALAGAGPWTLTLSSSHTHFYLEVDTSSAATFTLKSGTSFPNAGSETRIYPILEFTDSADTASCIEHQQSDIHLDIPPPKTASTDHGALVVDAGVISWAYASEDRQFLQRKADDTIDFDLPRRN